MSLSRIGDLFRSPSPQGSMALVPNKVGAVVEVSGGRRAERLEEGRIKYTFEPNSTVYRNGKGKWTGPTGADITPRHAAQTLMFPFREYDAMRFAEPTEGSPDLIAPTDANKLRDTAMDAFDGKGNGTAAVAIDIGRDNHPRERAVWDAADQALEGIAALQKNPSAVVGSWAEGRELFGDYANTLYSAARVLDSHYAERVANYYRNQVDQILMGKWGEA